MVFLRFDFFLLPLRYFLVLLLRSHKLILSLCILEILVVALTSILFLFGIKLLLLLKKYFLVLFLDPHKLILGLCIDSLKFILIFFVYSILDLLDVTGLEFINRFFVGGSDQLHLLRGSRSISLSTLPTVCTVSWGDFNSLLSDDWVLNFCSACASLSCFLSVRISLFACCWLFNDGKLSVLLILLLHSTLVNERISNILLMLLNLSLSLLIVCHNNLFLIGIFKIWIVNSFLFRRILFWLEYFIVVLLLQGWSQIRLLLIIFFLVSWLLVSISGCFNLILWLFDSAWRVNIFMLRDLALSKARFGSWFRGTSLLYFRATSSSLLHLFVVLVSVIHDIDRSIIMRVWAFDVLLVLAVLVSLVSLVKRLHILWKF